MFSDISSRVQENLAGVRVVRAYAQEKAEVAQFEQLEYRVRAGECRARAVARLFMPLLQAFIGFTFLLVMWSGGRQLLAQRITTGQLRHVQHLHGHVDLADDRVRLGGESDAARHGVAEPHQRDSA